MFSQLGKLACPCSLSLLASLYIMSFLTLLSLRIGFSFTPFSTSSFYPLYADYAFFPLLFNLSSNEFCFLAFYFYHLFVFISIPLFSLYFLNHHHHHHHRFHLGFTYHTFILKHKFG